MFTISHRYRPLNYHNKILMASTWNECLRQNTCFVRKVLCLLPRMLLYFHRFGGFTCDDSNTTLIAPVCWLKTALLLVESDLTSWLLWLFAWFHLNLFFVSLLCLDFLSCCRIKTELQHSPSATQCEWEKIHVDFYEHIILVRLE